MQFKTWILETVNKLGHMFARDDLPPRASQPATATGARPGEPEDPTQTSEHLGTYAPPIQAIRDELERFVAAHVRLHLAIAEHDRFLLTGLEVRTDDAGESFNLLQRFTREFKPEQIKRYLTREVIGALPNASAIELSQFGGLTLVKPAAEVAADDAPGEYSELLKALGAGPALQGSTGYEVSVAGRWVEGHPAPAPSGASPKAMHDRLQTPLARPGLEIQIEDARGTRSVALPAALPGRRHVIGKDESCDIVVEGTYASRRHCEIWFDRGAWWVLDVGSTNGIRVESGEGVQASGAARTAEGVLQPIELKRGDCIVLSALAEGTTQDYPRVALRQSALLNPLATPIAAAPAKPATPITHIVGGRGQPGLLTLTAHTGSGSRSVELSSARLPFTIGRSRDCTLVIDAAHEGVSGHHLDITAVTETAAVLVQGDNGVVVDAMPHPAGTRFEWKPGQTMELGRATPHEPTCTLTLAEGR